MKKFEEMNTTEKQEIKELFANWLSHYTHEVIVKVMERSEEIINNEFAMNLLRELKEREEKEQEDFTNSIGNLMEHFETFKEYDPHNHPLTHAGSYRDILYDMFIR
jgi:hypothetical protein